MRSVDDGTEAARHGPSSWRWRRRAGLVLLETVLGPAHLAFTSRQGGVSAPPFATLNLGLGLGDRDANVAENLGRLVAALGHAGVVASARQVHGARVVRVGGASGQSVPDADGLVSTEPGVALLLRFADCVPVFLVAPGPRPAVALVHAGWRGLAAGVVEAGVGAVCEASGAQPSALLGAIGPAIGPSYEVDAPVLDALRARYAGAAAWWGEDRVLDMTRAVREALTLHGIERTHLVETTERTESPAFFSHRASGGRTGRMAAVIRLGVDRPDDGGNAFPLAKKAPLRDWEGHE